MEYRRVRRIFWILPILLRAFDPTGTPIVGNQLRMKCIEHAWLGTRLGIQFVAATMGVFISRPSMKPPHTQQELFANSQLPEGFAYQCDFLSHAEEERLVGQIQQLPLQEALYRTFTAKRRIISFGAGYDFSSNRPTVAPPVPVFLTAIRERAAAWAEISADRLFQCTIAEYSPGTQLGWHRDVPTFGVVLGISLASSCRMRLRPYPHVKHRKSLSLVLSLQPRSIYVMRGSARWRWQHAISPTKALRYSITFRTMSQAA